MEKFYGILTGVTDEDLELLKKDPDAFWAGVTEIGDWAFKNTGLTSINIPYSVKGIEANAFHGCPLERIEVDKNNPEYKSEGNCLLSKDGTELLVGCKNSVIPDGVTEIGDYAFSGRTCLTSLNIPEGVTYIRYDAFYKSGLTSIRIPDSVTYFRNNAFAGCPLEKIEVDKNNPKYKSEGNCLLSKDGTELLVGCKNSVIPKSVTKIREAAFCCRGPTSISIPDSVTEIADQAFFGCSLERIEVDKNNPKYKSEGNCLLTKDGKILLVGCKYSVIPNSVIGIGWRAFSGCSKLKEITLECEDGDHKIKVDDNVLTCLEGDIGVFRNFVVARDRLKKTFLPAPQVVWNTPKDMVENFYKYSNNWGKLLGEFAKSVGKSPKDILDEPKADFYKLCLISGVFSDKQKEREEAMKFVEGKIIGKFTENELHERFTGLETKENGYNPEYAKFLRLNFDDNFMMKDFGGEEINYFASSYNRFKEVQKAYPNREVVTNTDNDRLTPELVEKYLQDNKYLNVTEETRKLSELCGFYGYSQGEFEVVSGWFLQGKQAKREGKQQLFCCPDEETREDVVTYEFLEKDNPLGAVLGDITNCCQKVGNAGESCCRHGMTDPKGGFVVFKKGGKIVGQSWVWYNKKMEKVCLDNVEVPRTAKSSVMHGDAGFIDCMRRLKDGFVEGMSEHKLPVSYVTMGEGYNDILDIARSEFAPVEDRVKSSIFAAVVQSASKKVLARSGGAPTGVYTDTDVGERLIK